MGRVLIIKTGRSETFCDTVSSVSSLGDVLRTTVVLNIFAGQSVTWLTSPEAKPLLHKNRAIAQILTDADIGDSFDWTQFETILNLERREKWTSQLEISNHLGILGIGSHLVPVALAPQQSWQSGLFALCGKEWRGEEYVFDYKSSDGPKGRTVGLNWEIGPKWPTKHWTRESWRQLEVLLTPHVNISWQRGFHCLDEYISWIESCDSIISADTLGLHLAIALKKPVVALFGPTSAEQVPLYGRGKSLVPSQLEYPCAPCSNRSCNLSQSCMSSITPEKVFQTYKELFE